MTDDEFKEHPVFEELDRYANFYRQLATSVFSFPTMGTKAICNIDSYVFSSMQGTIESIKMILLSGRINDAYALLRKFHDSAIINVYSNLYLKENFSIENFVVEKINSWLQGKESLPEYRVMSQYIKASQTLKPINDLLYRDDRYKCIRDRCNDHTHYNFFRTLILNDNEVFLKNRAKSLIEFRDDALDLFVMHLGYIFFLNDHYMMSSDYTDAVECGMAPEEGSQYWVDSFIQEIFNEFITPRRPYITAAIKEGSAMQLA